MAGKGKKRMTLAEHDAMLKATGQYDQMIERNRLQEEERQRQSAEWRAEEAPILAALRKVGIDVQSVWDLVNSENSYVAGLPVLAEHLERPYSARIKEGIARALTVRGAGAVVFEALMREFKRTRDLSVQGIKFALANALSTVADDSAVDELIQIARDPREGESRAAFLDTLARIGGERAAETLHELEDDPVIGDDARKAFARLGRKRPASS